MKKITILGAGLAGLLMSIYLAKRGFKVAIFERRSDIRSHGREEGRSINLAISVRGISALAEIGLDKKVLAKAVPMFGRMIHDVSEQTNSQPYGLTQAQAINSISRRRLSVELLNAADAFDNISIHFEHELVDMDLPNQFITFKTRKYSKSLSFDLLIAADGASSATRNILHRQSYIDCQRNYLDHGYKELTIDKEYAKALQKNYLHIWPRKSFMLIALPNYDDSFTCTLFLPYRGEHSFENIHNSADVEFFFQNQFPDALKLMPNVGQEFFDHPTGHLNTVTADTWHVADKVLLIGDSAHAILPFYGQGMNSAFEDCYILNKLLDDHKDDWRKVIKEFCVSRKIDTDAIAAMSRQNYLEMRDFVADTMFQKKKKIEAMLMRHYPDQYQSQYHLVTFTQKPYNYAFKVGQLQQNLLNDLATQFKCVDDLDEKVLDKLIAGYVNNV